MPSGSWELLAPGSCGSLCYTNCIAHSEAVYFAGLTGLLSQFTASRTGTYLGRHARCLSGFTGPSLRRASHSLFYCITTVSYLSLSYPMHDHGACRTRWYRVKMRYYGPSCRRRFCVLVCGDA